MYDELAALARAEFGDLVMEARPIGRRAGAALKLRLFLRDTAFVDVWLSPSLNEYSYHWEQRAKRGLLHRHDNAPDHSDVATHPQHFHNGAEDQIEASDIPTEPRAALRYFLEFIRAQLTTIGE
jgi:hypothetical protein